jgi:uncharacterized protein (DUF2132 family)
MSRDTVKKPSPKLNSEPPPMSDVREPDGRLVRELHGVSLKQIVEYLEKQLGFARMADHVPVNCFAINPSIKSSLTFLRRTEWARKEVEALYIQVRSDEISENS